jgi:hypothetical protein
MYVYFYSLHVSGSHVPIIRRINCINISGICHSVLRWPFGLQVWMRLIQTCTPNGHLYTVKYTGCCIFLCKAFSVLYVITIQSQWLISNFILSEIISLALNLTVHPLVSLCFCYYYMCTFLLCTYTSTVSSLTLILTLALSLVLH